METKSSVLLESLIVFYDNQSNFDKLLCIINKKNAISMRIIEWFITTYAKDKNKLLHCDYKNKLRGVNKTNFDPYCRKSKGKDTVILLKCKSGECYTTVAQANFYKWIIEKEILEYIENDYTEIYKKFRENTSRPVTG